MRRGLPLLILVAAALAGCSESISRRPDPLAKNVIDDAGLSSLLLAAGDAEQAVNYFETASAEEPERADFRRGLAIAYTRANRYPEAMRVYGELDALGQATPVDHLEQAFVAVRLQRWADAEALEARLPSGLDTARRHLLTAMLADNRQDWDAADSAYARAELLTSQPAKVFNNWGVSKMARGDLEDAEQMFLKALGYDSTLFSAKNNLAIARGLQGKFQLPIVPMTDREKATILNNLGIIAARQDKTQLAKGLFAAAVDAHPQHYEAAASRLASLETSVQN
ncbi:hypothetical protein LNKW23_21550 [Paralimibaculum aggregatum]|uniref:Tetratricopeptide repeat protein n=1 Tax=Paralimibaculum aggregatum TaxID=3036245 RepID=A0ABQ6LMN1_9RHOB|nr:tetratricopeptide repeat protein [Limibaculum sp. NKW23]GMG82942.1 hypothetical protein LNKW23_21550 [Limibaculum sp. NKW23]